MEFLLFNWDNIDEEDELKKDNPATISNERFRELAVKYGFIYVSAKDFEIAFNLEVFSTTSHQLRIIP